MSIEIIQKFAGILFSLGVVFAGVGYAYSQFWGGRNRQTAEQTQQQQAVLDLLQEQLNAVEKAAKIDKDLMQKQIAAVEEVALRHEKKVVELNNEVQFLKGQLVEKDAKLKEYLAILQNRNPQLEQYMIDNNKTIKSIEQAIQGLTNSK